MPKNIKHEWRQQAIALRRQGFSYREIRDRVPLAKSTLSILLRKIELSKKQARVLRARRSAVAKRNLENKIKNLRSQIKELNENSERAITQISKRELWLMGIILCWQHKIISEKSIQNGLTFINSDPQLIKLFLRWLSEVGKISKSELAFDIYKPSGINGDSIKQYWSRVININKQKLTHLYSLNNSSRQKYGLLRIRVKRSSLLARQVAGWIRGVRRFYSLGLIQSDQ